jgi:PAS domain S-box-containing protein
MPKSELHPKTDRGDHGVVPDYARILAAASSLSPQAYFIWSVATHRILAGADQLMALVGHQVASAEELSQHWQNYIHREDVPVALGISDQLANDPSKPASAQIRVKRADGGWDIIRLTMRPWRDEHPDHANCVIGLAEHVTGDEVPLAELQRREILSRKMIDESGDGIFLFDHRFALHYANRQLGKILGVKHAQLQGRGLFEVFDIAGKRSVIAQLKALSASDVLNLACDAISRDRKASAIDIDLRIRRLDENRYMGIARDITQERRVAEEMHQQAGYYKGLFRNNTSGVAVFDKDLKLAAVNRALANLLKYTEKELLGRSMIDCIAPHCQEDAKKLFYRMQRERRFNSLYRKGVELTLIRKDGLSVDMKVALTSIGDGVVLFSQGIAIFTDVTDEQRYRRERDQQARFNEVLLQRAPVGIIIANTQGQIIDINPAIEELTGYKMREILGKTGWECGVMHPDEVEGSKDRFRQLMEGAPKVNSTLRFLTKRGGIRIVEMQTTASRKPTGEIICLILTVVDVTEQKRLEAEIIKVAEQEQRRIGHDLHDGVGQILTGIMSLTEALEFDLKDEPAKQAGRIRELVREAIQQVRMLSHGLSPSAVQHRSLGSALKGLADRTQHSKLRCVYVGDWEPEFKDSETETHLFRMVQEALNNALKHGRPRKITISLTHYQKNQGLVMVEDDGVGIRLSKARKPEGIGIRVMKYRASLFGGIFQIRPRPEGGTEVSCIFSCRN